jgi:hypothetical protein
MRTMLAYFGSLQTLQGAPMGTYSLPSGPNAMYFQP